MAKLHNDFYNYEEANFSWKTMWGSLEEQHWLPGHGYYASLPEDPGCRRGTNGSKCGNEAPGRTSKTRDTINSGVHAKRTGQRRSWRFSPHGGQGLHLPWHHGHHVCLVLPLPVGLPEPSVRASASWLRPTRGGHLTTSL